MFADYSYDDPDTCRGRGTGTGVILKSERPTAKPSRRTLLRQREGKAAAFGARNQSGNHY